MADTAPSTGGKYVPPFKRNQMAAASTSTAASAKDVDPHGFAPRGDSRQGTPSFPRGGGGGGGDFRDPWGPPVGMKHPGGGFGNRSGSSRWDALDEKNDTSEYRSSRPPQSAGSGYYGGSKSRTGTGWDVRDGRDWRCENELEVFGSSEGKMSTGVNFDSYESIPVEVTGRGAERIEAIQTFSSSSSNIHPVLQDNIRRVKYEKPTPVQKYSIPVIFAGRDLMACAQTGSGKTAAFLFPVITKMLHDGPPPPATASTRPAYRRGPAVPVCLVLSPTRELAVQIYEEARKFAFGSGIRAVVLYGGAQVRNQLMELERGCDICVATPGRLGDMMERGKVKLQLVNFLVLDEADRMLDMGFLPKIKEIVVASDMPSNTEGRQTVMFSATFPNEIQQLAKLFLADWIFLTVGRIGSTNDFITQEMQYVEEENKERRVAQLLRDKSKHELTLIFVETKRKADKVEYYLQEQEFRATSIHGDRDQSEREYALRHFRSGKCPILVATDVAARGLDIPNIAHVINLDLPSNIDDYVHRIGRTGRAGNIGKATSFVNERNSGILRDLHGLMEEAGQEVPKWFTEMVRSCTAAGSGKFGRFGGRRGGNRGPNFGARDIRQMDDDRRGFPQRSSPSSNGRNFRRDEDDFRGGGGGYGLTSRPTKPPGYSPKVHNDVDDGW